MNTLWTNAAASGIIYPSIPGQATMGMSVDTTPKKEPAGLALILSLFPAAMQRCAGKSCCVCRAPVRPKYSLGLLY
jgi:hypothetical protein